LNGRVKPWQVLAAAAAGVLPVVTLGVGMAAGAVSVAGCARGGAAAALAGPLQAGGCPSADGGRAVSEPRSGLPRRGARSRADGVPGRLLLLAGGREWSVPRGATQVTLDGMTMWLPPSGGEGQALYAPVRRSPLEGWAGHAAGAGPPRTEPRSPGTGIGRTRLQAVRPEPDVRRQATPAVVEGGIPHTEADVVLLARVVQAEAGDQPYDAMLGVAAVVVNRVRAPGFPKTLEGVVYAPGQFQGVDSPAFYGTPSPAAVEAATAALDGVDPTGGALHFYNPALTWPGSWIFSLPVLATYGQLRFAR
jgi:hypothetical protein